MRISWCSLPGCAAVTLCLLLGCGSNGATPSAPSAPVTHVYAAGVEENATEVEGAVYWEDGVTVTLPD
jgi:hypothetical protein